MPVQTRSLPADEPSPPRPPPLPEALQEEEERGEEKPELPEEEEENSDDDEGGRGPENDHEFIFVKLSDIRKEIQCPICLGIIRKTRTVMECLHRFYRECIDKSMRLGNNECPACRTHCPSRHSLRDDPNYDALIAALYPDIDKYEEEESAFHEKEKNRNKKIQASIAETFRHQSEALGKRKPTTISQHRSSRGRGRRKAHETSLAGSEDEEELNEDANDNTTKESASSDEPRPNRRKKRCRKWTALNFDIGGEENADVERSRDNRGAPPLQIENGEMVAWGRGGVRSQSRHGNSSGANGRFVKGSRVNKIVEHLGNLDENDNELDVHVILDFWDGDGEGGPKLERPSIRCRPTLSISSLLFGRQ